MTSSATEQSNTRLAIDDFDGCCGRWLDHDPGAHDGRARWRAPRGQSRQTGRDRTAGVGRRSDCLSGGCTGWVALAEFGEPGKLLCVGLRLGCSHRSGGGGWDRSGGGRRRWVALAQSGELGELLFVEFAHSQFHFPLSSSCGFSHPGGMGGIGLLAGQSLGMRAPEGTAAEGAVVVDGGLGAAVVGADGAGAGAGWVAGAWSGWGADSGVAIGAGAVSGVGDGMTFVLASGSVACVATTGWADVGCADCPLDAATPDPIARAPTGAAAMASGAVGVSSAATDAVVSLVDP